MSGTRKVQHGEHLLRRTATLPFFFLDHHFQLPLSPNEMELNAASSFIHCYSGLVFFLLDFQPYFNCTHQHAKII